MLSSPPVSAASFAGDVSDVKSASMLLRHAFAFAADIGFLLRDDGFLFRFRGYLMLIFAD